MDVRCNTAIDDFRVKEFVSCDQTRYKRCPVAEHDHQIADALRLDGVVYSAANNGPNVQLNGSADCVQLKEAF